MKELISISVIIGVLLAGCRRPIIESDDARFSVTNSVVANLNAAKVGDIVVDSLGRRYRKLSNESLTNGAGVVDIWERIEPPNTNNWYTPTLSSRIIGLDIEFNSLYRGIGEKP
jgi:hypothetical protein